MPQRFTLGDHVRWNSEAGQGTGVIVKDHIRDTKYTGHVRRCTSADQQYETKRDATGHIAIHKGHALQKID